MKRSTISIVFAALAFTLFLPSLAMARDAFLGTWKAVITPEEDARRAGEKEIKDTFTFKGMKFTSETFSKRGFQPVDYSEDTRAGLTATFKAEAKNKKDKSTATWTGTSTGSDMTGELVVTKEDGTELRYTFKATRETRG